MKLKILTVEVKTLDQFMTDAKKRVERALKEKTGYHNITVGSPDLFKKRFTPNRMQVLMVISRMKPKSVNQIAKILGRDYPHVLSDCRELESMHFIKLEETDSLRKQLVPKLYFEYDLIRFKGPIEEIYSISERSNKVLLGNINA